MVPRGEPEPELELELYRVLQDDDDDAEDDGGGGGDDSEEQQQHQCQSWDVQSNSSRVLLHICQSLTKEQQGSTHQAPLNQSESCTTESTGHQEAVMDTECLRDKKQRWRPEPEFGPN